MILETLILFASLYVGVLTVGFWRQDGYRAGAPIALLLGALVFLFFSPHFSSKTFKGEVLAVNKDRTAELQFEVGDTVSVSRPKAEGILAPFEVAVRKAEDGRVEVLRNRNRLVWWKFNSKALQFELSQGGTYEFKVAGWIGIPNIVSFQPIRPTQQGRDNGHDDSSGAKRELPQEN